MCVIVITLEIVLCSYLFYIELSPSNSNISTLKMDFQNDISVTIRQPSSDFPLAPTIMPALSTSVHFGLTITFIVLYGFLFLFVYLQLILILWYRHKRFSYQSTFLFLCLIWAALRTTLFSFYFKNPVLANNLPTFLFWLLYCFPICLQFVTLCLLVLYFSQVISHLYLKWRVCNFWCCHFYELGYAYNEFYGIH